MIRVVTVTLNPAIDHTLSVPNFAAGSVNQVSQEIQHAAGKGVNVSVLLRGLNVGVVATGLLGSQNSDKFEEMMASNGIEDQFVRVEGRNRTGLKIVDPASGQTTDINFPGLHPRPEAADELCDRIVRAVAKGTWVVLAGSVPGGLDTQIYVRLIDLIHACGGRVALDTSGNPFRHAILRSPAMIKPNIDKLAALTGWSLMSLADRIAAAKRLVAEFKIELAVLSMGSSGAIFATSDACILARPPKVDVRSTVGAGDAMVAGAVYGLASGDTIQNIARLATALGADAVTRVAAGIDPARSFEALLGEVAIEVVD